MLKKAQTNKKTKYKNLQTKNKGITLIALVITIIVILILAGVSINTLFGDNGLLTKADQARVANEKARIYDMVATEVFASYDNKGELDQKTLIENLEGMPAEVTGLDEYKENLANNNVPIWPMEFQVDGYNVTVDADGNVTVEGLGGGGSGGGTTPSDKTLTEITLSIEPEEINVGETATLTATMNPTDANDTLEFTASPEENVEITPSGTTATIKGVKAGEVEITVSGTKAPSVSAKCNIRVKAVEVAELGAADLAGQLETAIGEPVTGLTGGACEYYEWKLFYAGSIADESNIYLIASDYIESKDAPTGKSDTEITKKRKWKRSIYIING